MSNKWEKKIRNFFIPFFAQKAQSEKKLKTFFSKNVADETLVYYTKPWTLYLVSVLRNKGRNMKHSKNLRFFKTFFKKKQEAEFFLKNFFNEKVAKESTQLLARTKVFRISFQFWGKSVTNYEKMGSFSKFFFIPLFAQKNRSKKNSTSLLVLNAAYWALLQITKPWTAYLFSVLRYRGSSIK